MRNTVKVAKTDFLQGNIFKSLLLFMIPLLISRIFQQMYNTVDTMIVGNYLGEEALAAMGAASAVYELLLGFALGIGSGLSIVTARSFGTGDKVLLKRSVAGALVIGVGLSLLIAILSIFLLRPALRLMNTPEEIIGQSYAYVSTLLLCVGVMFAYNLLAGLLRSIGNSIAPLVFLVLSALLNIFLDLLFITRFHMGIQGAAVATVLAQGISAFLCVIYIIFKCRDMIPSWKHFRFDADLYKELLGQGLSMGFMSAIVSAGTVILQSAINGLGYLTIAGHTAARKINSFCMMPVGVVGMALSTFVSQNRGAGQGERIRKGVRYANLMCVGCGMILMLILYPGAPALVSMISGSEEALVLENGTKYLWFTAPFYMVLGVLFNLRNSLQAIGTKILPLISSVIECVGKILFAMIIIPKLGYRGVILCEPVIWCIMTVQLVWAFYTNSYMKQFCKKHLEKEKKTYDF
uniref:MATE family efflux transporter n=1 Tax=Acetatifactor sp. TaxID=1872090 RepID=UPI004055CE65